jgi:hypothetical protein
LQKGAGRFVITSASQMWLTTMLARLPTMTTHFYLNSKLHRNNIPETWLPEELCVPFGFCGQEYDSILLEVNQNGRTAVVF